jgi:hypothetical protein
MFHNHLAKLAIFSSPTTVDNFSSVAFWKEVSTCETDISPEGHATEDIFRFWRRNVYHSKPWTTPISPQEIVADKIGSKI